jgi:NADH dehydrogenase FAD-containing subunit
MAKTILILGASYAGLQVTHRLLKHTLPGLKEDYKVIVVSPSSHHYWNLASVRAIVPGQIPDEKIFADVAEGLAHYKDKAEFVLGAASALDPNSKIVTIQTASGERKQAYDILVLATGSRTIGDVPWKASLAGYEATRDRLHKVQEQVKAAKSIVVGGAGRSDHFLNKVLRREDMQTRLPL